MSEGIRLEARNLLDTVGEVRTAASTEEGYALFNEDLLDRTRTTKVGDFDLLSEAKAAGTVLEALKKSSQ